MVIGKVGSDSSRRDAGQRCTYMKADPRRIVVFPIRVFRAHGGGKLGVILPNARGGIKRDSHRGQLVDASAITSIYRASIRSRTERRTLGRVSRHDFGLRPARFREMMLAQGNRLGTPRGMYEGYAALLGQNYKRLRDTLLGARSAPI